MAKKSDIGAKITKGVAEHPIIALVGAVAGVLAIYFMFSKGSSAQQQNPSSAVVQPSISSPQTAPPITITPSSSQGSGAVPVAPSVAAGSGSQSPYASAGGIYSGFNLGTITQQNTTNNTSNISNNTYTNTNTYSSNYNKQTTNTLTYSPQTSTNTQRTLNYSPTYNPQTSGAFSGINVGSPVQQSLLSFLSGNASPSGATGSYSSPSSSVSSALSSGIPSAPTSYNLGNPSASIGNVLGAGIAGGLQYAALPFTLPVSAGYYANQYLSKYGI